MSKPAAYCYRKGAALHACTPLDAELLEAITPGRVVAVTWVRRRSDRQERFVHALITIVAKGTGTPRDVMYDQIRYACGMVEEFATFDGELKMRLRSTARDAMPDAADYNNFVNRVVEVVIRDVLPHIHARHLVNQVEQMLRLVPEADTDVGRSDYHGPDERTPQPRSAGRPDQHERVATDWLA